MAQAVLQRRVVGAPAGEGGSGHHVPAAAALFWVWHSHRPCFGPGSGGTGPLDLPGDLPTSEPARACRGEWRRRPPQSTWWQKGGGRNARLSLALPLAGPGEAHRQGTERGQESCVEECEPNGSARLDSGFQCVRCHCYGSNLIHCDVTIFLTEQEKAVSSQRKPRLGLKPCPQPWPAP